MGRLMMAIDVVGGGGGGGLDIGCWTDHIA